MRPDRDRLEDILEAIEEIRRRLPETAKEWMASRLLQVWVVHHLQVIGEASNNLSPGLVAAHPEVPWQCIADMHQILVHQHFGVDFATVWRTVTDDLPPLEAAVRAILTEAW